MGEEAGGAGPARDDPRGGGGGGGGGGGVAVRDNSKKIVKEGVGVISVTARPARAENARRRTKIANRDIGVWHGAIDNGP